MNNYLFNNEEIIEIINSENRIVIFFTNGLILEIDHLEGEIIFFQNLKLKNIISVKFFEQYTIISLFSGKTVFFRQ